MTQLIRQPVPSPESAHQLGSSVAAMTCEGRGEEARAVCGVLGKWWDVARVVTREPGVVIQAAGGHGELGHTH